MRAEEREDARYSAGSQNPIAQPEEILFSMLPEGNGRKLLDVGCGIGTISLELQQKGFEVRGVDFSRVGVGKCLEKGLDAICSDVDKDGLAFADKSFDVVWAGDVIEHVFDPIFLFEEMARVLKDDGRILLTVPNNFNFRQRRKLFFSGKSIQSGVYKKSGQCKHHTFFSWDLLEYMIKKAKLSIEDYSALCGKRKKQIKKVTKNKLFGRLFGRVFIIKAHKI